MKISFCTTCKGRLEHLKLTLPQNIKDNLPESTDDPSVEFVVLDYDCPDGTVDWLLNDVDMLNYVREGIIKIAKFGGGNNFHHAHAKNMAHRLAIGDVVCNLDADNYTGPRFARYVADEFTKNHDIVLHPCNEVNGSVPQEERGFYGRISMTRDNYLSLGGYDEIKYPSGCGWGGEDTHFLRRARISGLKDVTIKNRDYLNVIAHSNDERVNLTVDKELVASEADRIGIDYSRTKAMLDRLYVVFHSAQSIGGRSFGLGSVYVGVNQLPQNISAIEHNESTKSHRTVTGISGIFTEYTISKANKVVAKLGLTNPSVTG